MILQKYESPDLTAPVAKHLQHGNIPAVFFDHHTAQKVHDQYTDQYACKQ